MHALGCCAFKHAGVWGVNLIHGCAWSVVPRRRLTFGALRHYACLRLRLHGAVWVLCLDNFYLHVLRMCGCLYMHFEGALPCAIITDNISITPDSSIVMMKKDSIEIILKCSLTLVV